MTRSGAGRPVDANGIPEGPWTPSLLTDALAQIEENHSEIDLRSVQRWFSDDDRGPSYKNMRWLARIFGCGDPERSSKWQAALSRAQSLSKANRRERRKFVKLQDPKSNGSLTESARRKPPTVQMKTDRKEQKKAGKSDAVTTTGDAMSNPAEIEPDRFDASKNLSIAGSKRRFSLPTQSECLFSGSALNLPATVFAGAVALGFISYFLSIHDVKLASPESSVPKQLGFLWAPNWTILFLAVMPLFFAFVAELITFWKTEGRSVLSSQGNRSKAQDVWHRKLQASSYTFWAVFVICFLFVGVLQWVGIRLVPLIKGGGNHALDWGSLAIKHPEVISKPAQIAFTAAAYMYMAICFFFLFAGLILLYTVANDAWSLREKTGNSEVGRDQLEADRICDRVMTGIFRCTILAILIAVCMKLQSAYLESPGTNIVTWVMGDMAKAFSSVPTTTDINNYDAPNHFSSLILVMSGSFVFLYGACRLNVARQGFYRWSKMTVVAAVLVVSYLLIGAFPGFSIILAVGVALAIYSLCGPGIAPCPNNNQDGN